MGRLRRPRALSPLLRRLAGCRDPNSCVSKELPAYAVELSGVNRDNGYACRVEQASVGMPSAPWNRELDDPRRGRPCPVPGRARPVAPPSRLVPARGEPVPVRAGRVSLRVKSLIPRRNPVLTPGVVALLRSCTVISRKFSVVSRRSSVLGIFDPVIPRNRVVASRPDFVVSRDRFVLKRILGVRGGEHTAEGREDLVAAGVPPVVSRRRRVPVRCHPVVEPGETATGGDQANRRRIERSPGPLRPPARPAPPAERGGGRSRSARSAAGRRRPAPSRRSPTLGSGR